MAQRLESEEKDSIRESVEAAFAILKLPGFKFSRVGQVVGGRLAEFQATRCVNGKIKARARVFCECIGGKLEVGVFLSAEGARTKHLAVILKDDCNCRNFQVLEYRNKRAVFSLSGSYSP